MTSDTPDVRARLPLTVEEFRAEARDKLFVVFHGCHGSNLQRMLSRNQCEDFLVERYAEALNHDRV